MICVYEHRPGPGASALGGGAPSVENWRTKLVLRGHANNVVDLGWSPDDAQLASASIDNTVCIGDAASGQRLQTLSVHTSFVKGLAWDPVGTYLATQASPGGVSVSVYACEHAGGPDHLTCPAHPTTSTTACLRLQSEDKSVVIWRCADWSRVTAVRAPYAKMVTATFSTRMSWSPDGAYLATGACRLWGGGGGLGVEGGLACLQLAACHCTCGCRLPRPCPLPPSHLPACLPARLPACRQQLPGLLPRRGGHQARALERRQGAHAGQRAPR